MRSMQKTSKGRRAAIAAVVLLLAACQRSETNAGGPQNSETGEVRRFELTTRSDTINIGDNVTFEGFTFNGTMPGPQMEVNEGDTVEIAVINEDSVTHGLSIHAANGQASNYVGNIAPGETRTLH